MRLYLALVFLIPLVAGINYSPSSLTYLSKPGEELCHVIIFENENINLEPEEKIVNLFDLWAKDFDTEKDIDKFEISAHEHGLTLNYPEEISSEMGEIEICISGSEVGKYRGALVFNDTLESVWLDVFIEENENFGEELEPSTSGNGGGGGGTRKKISLLEEGKRIDGDFEEQNEIEVIGEEIFEEIGKEPLENTAEPDHNFEALSQEEKYRILFGDIEDNTITFWNYIPIAFILFLVGARVYVARKRRKTIN